MTEDHIPNFKPYPTLRQTWILFLLFVGLNLAAGFLVVPFQDVNRNLGIFIAYTVGMGVTYLLARKLKQDDEGRVVHAWQAGGNWMIYPVLLLVTWAAMACLTPIVELIPLPDQIREFFENLIDTSSIWIFLSLVVAAPLLEELVFRGIILDGFLRRYPARKSILWSSFFFGLFHLNPWQFITAFGLGILLGWVYHRTRSLLPCIAIHAFANGTSFFMAANMTEQQKDMTMLEAAGGLLQLALTLALALAVLYFGVQLLDRMLRTRGSGTAPEEVK